MISTRGIKEDALPLWRADLRCELRLLFNHGGYDFAKQFYHDAYQAAIKIVGGEQYILSAVMHADERNRAMSDALGQDVYPLPPSCGLCAGGGEAGPMVQEVQGQVAGRQGKRNGHAGQHE